MSKEILIPHAELEDSQTITEVVTNKMKEHDLDIHQHEVEDIDDDDKAGIRRLRVKNTKYFAMGNVPWHRTSS